MRRSSGLSRSTKHSPASAFSQVASLSNSLPLSRWARPPFIGIAYLFTREAKISEVYRKALYAPDRPTAIINLFTGRPRGAFVNRLMADPARCPTSSPHFRQPAAPGGRCAVLQRLPDATTSARSGQDSPSRSQSRCPQQLDTDARWRKRVGFGAACRLMHSSKTAVLRSPRRRNSVYLRQPKGRSGRRSRFCGLKLAALDLSGSSRHRRAISCKPSLASESGALGLLLCLCGMLPVAFGFCHG
jgi:hypothetical protein